MSVAEPAAKPAAAGTSPAHGEHDGQGDQAGCLNCGTPLIGPHCHACGQSAHVHKTLAAFAHDLVHGVFHFEGRIWRTLPMLALRPGQLTREYVDGRRASYISPLALFLFVMFLLFATFGSLGAPFGGARVEGRIAGGEDMQQVRKATAEKIARLERQRRAAVAAGTDTGDLDRDLADARLDQTAANVADLAINGPRDGAGGGGDTVDIKTGSRTLDERVAHAVADPRLFFYKLQTKAYKYAWALIILSLPFMWLLFAGRRRIPLYDHAVFVTYSLCAVSLLMVAMAVLAAAGLPVGWLWLLVPVHFYLQLRGAYRLSRRAAAWRTAALLVIAGVVMILFSLLLLALGLGG